MHKNENWAADWCNSVMLASNWNKKGARGYGWQQKIADGYKYRKPHPDKWEVGQTWRQSIKEAEKIQLNRKHGNLWWNNKDSLPRNGSKGWSWEQRRTKINSGFNLPASLLLPGKCKIQCNTEGTLSQRWSINVSKRKIMLFTSSLKHPFP